MKDLICPHCGAMLGEGTDCEYCGRATGIKIVSEDEGLKLLQDERLIPLVDYIRYCTPMEGEIGKIGGIRYVVLHSEEYYRAVKA